MKGKWSYAVLLLTLAIPVAADNIIEPDAYPAGTDISHLFPDATLSAVNRDTVDPVVFAVAPRVGSWASTGALVFGHATPYDEHWIVNGAPGFRYGALRVDFTPYATRVDVDVIGNDSSDYGLLEAYSAAGVLLGSVQTGQLAEGGVQMLSIGGVGNIGYVIAGGFAADTVCLDHMVWVPEPATACALLLIVAGACRRRG